MSNNHRGRLPRGRGRVVFRGGDLELPLPRDMRQNDALLASDSQEHEAASSWTEFDHSSFLGGRGRGWTGNVNVNETAADLDLDLRSEGPTEVVDQEQIVEEDGRNPLDLDLRMSINPAHDTILRTTGFFHSTDTATPAATPLSRARARLRVLQTTEDSERERVRYIMADAAANNMDGALPEDDGMRSLRQKLQEIKELAVSTEEKAKRMHLLMMKDYVKHKELGQLTPPQSPAAPESDGLLDSPLLGDAVMPIDPNNPYNLRPGDLEPVWSPLPKAPRGDNDGDGDDGEAMMSDDDDDMPDLGCMHYKRNVKVQCFDCQRWYPCRHCHDQARDLPFPHALNRQKTQNMLCMVCQTPQPAAQECISCGNYAAWYYCSKCKLWDNDTNKRIYHCDDCGICRVGEGLGKDFVHCKRCNVCISISTSAAHPCIERATEGNCPLCLMRMFEAKVPVVSLPCGHYMHGECYKDLMAVTYKCPVCSKSAVNMELQWRKLDDEIALQPLPEDDLEGLLPHIEGAAEPSDETNNDTNDASPPRRPRKVWIGCNDCGARSWTPFHWLGLKCQRCDSYNTNQMTPTAHHETEAERLLRQQTQSVRHHDFTGNDVLRDAGIGMVVDDTTTTAASELQVPRSALEVPESPSQQPSGSPNSRGAQSPGRYFVTEDPEIRRPSFSGRFSAPSMPNLPTLSEMPRLPRMPTMPNMPTYIQDMRQNFNMPNVELGLPRFRPYASEMMDAVSRSLSPMRYYLRGLDMVPGDGDDDAAHLPHTSHLDARMMMQRSGSVRSDPSAAVSRRRGSKLRASSDVDSMDLFGNGEEESGESSGEEEDGSDEEEDEDPDTEMLDADDDVEVSNLDRKKKDKLDFELLGHR